MEIKPLLWMYRTPISFRCHLCENEATMKATLTIPGKAQTIIKLCLCPNCAKKEEAEILHELNINPIEN